MKLYPKNLVIMILITTIIIDVMAAGLVFPIMPSLFFDNICVTFGDPGGNFQNWYYSIALSCWPLGLLIGCPIIGELSDKYGRKSILIIALISTFLSYLLSIYAIYSHNFIMFVASRFISGLAGGAFEIAQAAIIDMSDEESKSKNIGFVTMAASLGFVIGPVITSLVASVNVHHTLPFAFAAVMAFINVIFVAIVMKKDLPKNPGLIIQIGSIYKTISFLVSDKRVRVIGVVYLLLQCGWGFYGQGVALFLDHVYDYSVADIGAFYALMGLSTAVACLVLQPKLFTKFSNSNVFVPAAIVLGVGSILVGVIGPQEGQWILAVILSVSQLLCYTALLTMISSAVSSREQGKAMGAAGAGFGLAWFLNDLMMGHLSSTSPSAPITFGGGMFFVAVILFVFAVKIMKEKVE
ncbi:MFS transporter [Francisella adeliensis]|uniref:MFS transporter n=1 Tax=Francisella adeliensis TaxID=2007306 RepID=A0A2Z4Y034_9GAMM|nr:MFS transporter [Francisella adeliensis]AXA34053.1 MFS transporter [Francisella adeliensis]MBK2085216.1 MFS transporter [Francisella adeliensis]MBK2096016.1 MFS transporter [Francisella adeliensis]QIW12292.1 MFS transporter [Francisella adeliensis]QIW14166.1 MFS transporter [Francisella adeliensis]